jgi:predicted dehydrogenase
MAGRDFHAPLLRAAPGLRVTHVSTSDPARARSAAEDQSGVAVVPAFDDLLAVAGDLDLVVVASPSGVHVEQASAFVRRGVPVVVDKPLGLDADSARRLVDLAAERDVALTVFQNRRWDAEHLTAKTLLSSGDLGEVVRYEARYERWRPQPKSRWRENLPDAEGGGLLLDLQTHLVDQAVELFGPVDSVFAELRAVTTVGDDVTFLALHHAGGVRSHLSATALAGAPGPRTRILGSAGTYLVAASDGEPTAYREWADRDDDHRGWLVRGEDAEPVRRAPGGWGDFYPAVAAAVRDGKPMPVDPHDAVAVLKVIDAARRSAATGAVVALDVR